MPNNRFNFSEAEKGGGGIAYITINNEDTAQIKCDNVILGLESYSNEESLTGTNKRVYRIGDCKSPGNIMDAIADAYEVVKEITEVRDTILR